MKYLTEHTDPLLIKKQVEISIGYITLYANDINKELSVLESELIEISKNVNVKGIYSIVIRAKNLTRLPE